MLIASCPIGGIPVSGQPLANQVSSSIELPYEPAVFVVRQLLAEYGTLYAKRGLVQLYPSPISSELAQPIAFITRMSLDAPWSLRTKVSRQRPQSWNYTMLVGVQCDLPYDVLLRDPVVAGMTQIWDLSGDQALQTLTSAVRAFHHGELV